MKKARKRGRELGRERERKKEKEKQASMKGAAISIHFLIIQALGLEKLAVFHLKDVLSTTW